MDLAETVEAASFQNAAADETGEDDSQWGEAIETKQQAAPQYNAQQVLQALACIPCVAKYDVYQHIFQRFTICGGIERFLNDSVQHGTSG